jgi:putative MATE family efflux protein
MQKTPGISNGNHVQNVLDTDRVGWLLVKLATPAFFGMFVHTLYNVVNTIFIGHFVGPLAIAGLSIVFPLQMLGMGIGMMVGMGGASLISRFLGAGNITDAERTIGNGISVGIILSLAVTAVILPLTDYWLRIIGASDDVLPYAREYLVIIISGNVFGVFAMALMNFARSEGNARVGMTAMILGGVLNIILDAVFIVWMGMGVTGAAMGTVIGQFVSMIYLIAYYLTGSSYLKIHMRNLRLDLSILKQMFAIGVAAFAQTVAGSLSAMLLINMVVKYGGDVALGAFGIIQRTMMFAIMPAIVFGQGLQPILGFNYGAKRYHLALKAMAIAAIVSTSLSILGFLVLYFFPGPIMRIFTDDVPLIEMGVYASRLVFLTMPLMGGVMIGQTVFQAIGKAMQAFITAIARPVAFLIPAVLLMAHFWQLDGVFLAYPVSDVFTLILTLMLLSPIINQFRRDAAANQPGETEPFHSGQLLDSSEGGRVAK